MSDYVPAPLPVPGDEVHAIGPFPCQGDVMATLPDGDGQVIVVVRYRVARGLWQCVTSADWRSGIIRPGRIPERLEDGRWPWEVVS